MLTLPIKKQWYDMIRSGEKLEEYRDATPYYAARFAKYAGDFDFLRVRFRNGYRKDSPTIECHVRPRLRYGAKRKWGGDPEKACWVLEIWDVKDVTGHGSAQV